jgi:hypothetical protein
MHDLVMHNLVSKLQEFCDDFRADLDTALDEARDEGRDEGQDEAEEEWNEKVEEAKQEGYNEGFEDGVDEVTSNVEGELESLKDDFHDAWNDAGRAIAAVFGGARYLYPASVDQETHTTTYDIPLALQSYRPCPNCDKILEIARTLARDLQPLVGRLR